MDFLETSPISPEAFTTPSAGTTSSSLYLPLPVSPLLALQKKYRRKNIIQVLRRSFGNRYPAVCHHHPGQRRIHEAYNTVRQKAYLCASTTSMYTVFGSLCYDLINQKQEATPQIQQEIKEWLSQKPGHHPLAGRIRIRNNCIVILAESLESWVLEREVEGQEITHISTNCCKTPPPYTPPRTDASERRALH